MLVLSRKTQEFVQIGEGIVVKIIRTSKGSVKIGIDAPGGTRILRGELADDGETPDADSETGVTPAPQYGSLHERIRAERARRSGARELAANV